MGNESAHDSHMGMGITVNPAVCKVCKAAGTEHAFEVTEDVKANLVSNGTDNMSPHVGDTKDTSINDPTVEYGCLDATTIDFFCVGTYNDATDATSVVELKCTAHASRNLVI